MSDKHTASPTAASADEPRLVGLVAEFTSPEAILAAGAATREEGYRELEAFTPFPIHGIDQAIGVRPTILPWLVLGAGLTGAVAAIGLEWFTNAVDYPFLISGKPLFSLPANIPVAFEVIILLSSVTAFLGVWALNRLPQYSNPLLASERFLRATTDRFFLLVRAKDGKFAEEKTRAWLHSLGAVSVEAVWEPAAGTRLPRGVLMIGALAACVALLPPLWIAGVRASTSAAPRLYVFSEMFFQPKFKPQTPSTLFTDGRAMRPPVPGTVARGELQADERFYRGVQPGERPATKTKPGASPEPKETNDSQGPKESKEPSEPEEPNWVQQMPVEVTPELMKRGRLQFNVYCATCHGRAGDGDGLVSQRAKLLQQGTWLSPTSLHADAVRQQPVGKLYNTITNGVRKMPGYGRQIPVLDRWAVVLYVRALQRSQRGSLDDVPVEERRELQVRE
jgi:mono/diheme cytochrome c family protein